jgi:hypothetical protein
MVIIMIFYLQIKFKMEMYGNKWVINGCHKYWSTSHLHLIKLHLCIALTGAFSYFDLGPMMKDQPHFL